MDTAGCAPLSIAQLLASLQRFWQPSFHIQVVISIHTYLRVSPMEFSETYF